MVPGTGPRKGRPPGPLLRTRADRHVVQPGPPRRGPGHQPRTAGSPWWAAEAAELAERGGLRARARAEAHQAVSKLLGQLDSLDAAPRRSGPHRGRGRPHSRRHRPASGRPAAGAMKELTGRTPDSPAPDTEFDVAAEVERLEKDRVRLGGLHWMLDPGLAPEGLFRPGLSPYSDLSVRHDSTKGRLIVHALLTPGAAAARSTAAWPGWLTRPSVASWPRRP